MAQVGKLAWITGASSGIGRELANQLARRETRVAATARTETALATLAANSDAIASFPADVTDAAGIAETVDAIERAHGPIDVAVLNAGYWEPISAETFDVTEIAKTMDVNYLGVVHCLAALLPRMMDRRRGHIAIVSSVAGYRGLPRSAAYGPSKAALINLAESLKPELEPFGVRVQLINPGFVATPMTAKNDFEMPMILSVQEAAERVVAGLDSSRFEVAFPWAFATFLKLARIVPYRVFFWYVRRFILPRS